MSDSKEIRNKTYQEISETLPLARKRVLNKILQIRPCTRQQVQNELGLEANEVSGRFTELKDMFLIREVGETSDTSTGHSHTIWDIIETQMEREYYMRDEIERISKENEAWKLILDVAQDHNLEIQQEIKNSIKKTQIKLNRIKKIWKD